jgi:hypothetical protein
MVGSSVFPARRRLCFNRVYDGPAVPFSTERAVLLCVDYTLHCIDMFRENRQAHGPVSEPQPVPSLTRSVIWCYR